MAESNSRRIEPGYVILEEGFGKVFLSQNMRSIFAILNEEFGLSFLRHQKPYRVFGRDGHDESRI